MVRKKSGPGRGIFVGLCTVDIVYLVREPPRPDSKSTARRQEIRPGGPAANAAITFVRLGGEAVLVSAVGRHPLAAIVRDDLDRLGVRLVDLRPELDEAPSISSIWVTAGKGDRTVVSANATRFPARADAFDRSILSGASVVLVDGHHMDLCIEAAAEAHRGGITVVLDGGSWKSGTDELLRRVDAAVCSRNFHPPGCRDEWCTLDYLIRRGMPEAAVTRGSRPVILADRQGRGEIPVPAVKVVDTLGAGDVFHGAFCYQYASGADFRDALRFAAGEASRSCRHYGILPDRA